MASYYDDDEPRRYRNVQTRPRERGEPDYVREETYIERGKGPPPRDLVYRGREDSIEDIPRDFPPPGGRDREYRRTSYRDDYDDYNAQPRRAKSAAGSRVSRRYDDYDDDRYTDYGGAAAAGGAAGYAAGRRGGDKRRRRRGDRDYDSEYSSSRSPPRSERSRPERRKSGVEELLGGLGLAGLAGALTGKKDKDRDRSDSRSVKSGRTGRSRSRAASRRRYSDDDSRSRSRGGGKKETEKKWAQAAQAALVAGAITAFRSRKEAGPWTGEKGKRIATAAISAGGIDGLLDRNPNEKTKRHLAEAVIGGLATNRLANGPTGQSKSRGRDGSMSPDGRPRSRSRSIIDRFRGRSQSRGRGAEDGGGGAGGALKGLAAGGALAAAGKAIYDRVRSKSRKRGGSRDRDSSADSYVPSRNRRRDKRRSPRSDTEATRSLGGPDRGLSRDPGSRGIDGGNGALVGAGAGAGAGALAAQGGSRNGGGSTNGGNGNQQKTGDDLVSGSSSTTEIEEKRKKMRGKELLTAGLATIATIHAAHGVYSSMESHEKRHKMVAEGTMTPEEARKKQTKAWVQDAAAVGIAALGIKGAFSEWKEMNEHRTEIHEIEKRKRQRRKKQAARKKQEEREMHDRMVEAMKHNPQMAMMQQMGGMGGGMPGMGGMPMYNMPTPQPYSGGGGQNRYTPPQPDQSGNPYASRDDGGRGRQ